MKKSGKSKFLVLVLLLVTLGVAPTSNSSETNLCQGFIPENRLRIPVAPVLTGGLTEKQFNDILDRIQQLYAIDAADMGDQLLIVRQWAAETVNARADRHGNIQQLTMYGGLARHPLMTDDAFALVACHELGHHQGGAPKKFSVIDGSTWMTNEGGADYFASLKCLRRFFASDNNHQVLVGKNLEPVAVARCEQQFQNVKDQEICLRTSVAIRSVTSFFQAVKGESKKAAFNTPDTSAVSKTSNSHPTVQCRMDTLFAGMICHVPESDPVDNLDYKKGSCFTPNDQIGFRPRCWFAPPS